MFFQTQFVAKPHFGNAITGADEMNPPIVLILDQIFFRLMSTN